MGGPGSEREVSLASGREVVKALSGGPYKLIESDVDPQRLDTLPVDDNTVVFPALHGAFGEGGELQEHLESRHIRFIGSNAESAALAMDKYKSKQTFLNCGLPTPPAEILTARQSLSQIESTIKSFSERHGFPTVIKPNTEGSSVGVHISGDMISAVKAATTELQNYSTVLLEKFLSGKELTVGVLGERALPVIEIRPAKGFYDYYAKYESDETEYAFSVSLNQEKLLQIQTEAIKAFKALGCRDFGRVDFMTDADDNHSILEVNTIPGLTTHSLLPKAAAKAGIPMPELCEQIVRLALKQPI
jgi:D-alanine-D-alanine ligase